MYLGIVAAEALARTPGKNDYGGLGPIGIGQFISAECTRW